MARYKKRFTKPQPSRFSRFVKGASTALTTAQKVAQVAQVAYRVAGMVNAEKQYYDNNNSGNASTPNETGNTYSISGIPQGDDEGGRTGNSILMKSLYLTVRGSMNASATNSCVRMLVVQDKFNTGTTPAPSDIMQYNGSAFSVVSPLNVDHTTRYRVIYDKLFKMSINGDQQFIVKKFLKYHKHIHYTGPNATDTYGGNIYLIFVSDEATNTPNIVFNARIGYYDN